MSTAPISIDDYAVEVHREVVRLVARRRRSDAFDIAQRVVVTFLSNPEPIMAARPRPVDYARAASRNATIAFDRTESAQRGSGARRYRSDDPGAEPARRVISGDATVGDSDTTVFDLLVDTGMDVEAVVVDGANRRDHLARCMLGLSRDDRTALYMVRGEGYEVREVARHMGVRPETMSRRLARSAESMRSRAAMTPTRIETP